MGTRRWGLSLGQDFQTCTRCADTGCCLILTPGLSGIRHRSLQNLKPQADQIIAHISYGTRARLSRLELHSGFGLVPMDYGCGHC